MKYEALKSGSSVGELIEAFNKELTDAQKKIREDQEQKEKAAAAAKVQKMSELEADLDDARAYLAEAILDYLDAYADYITEGKYENKESICDTVSLSQVEDLLREAEKSVSVNIMALLKFCDLEKTMGKSDKRKKETSMFTDEAIIRNFIKNMK